MAYVQRIERAVIPNSSDDISRVNPQPLQSFPAPRRSRRQQQAFAHKHHRRSSEGLPQAQRHADADLAHVRCETA